MKRISYLLLPLLLLSALAPFAPFTLTAGAVTGAAFTTVNVAVDGPGHCLNGNPAVNCNIYNGKSFVWLNGGPKANKLGPSGQYFFAVLAPGGQPNANDGSPKNLSDDFDAHTNRTFTVTSGKVSAYSGTHTFNRMLIRLFPYANTPNPGGVYILAICSLSNGYPVKASACKFDQFKVMRALPPTNTPTPTPTACLPKIEHANFKAVALGQSVQGLGIVAPDLNIVAHDMAVRVQQGSAPIVWVAGPNAATINGGMDPSLGGFADYQNHVNLQQPQFTFTFGPNVTVTDFKLHMLDFGDFNPHPVVVNNVLQHVVTMQGYAGTVPVPGAQQTLTYTTVGNSIFSSPQYGNLLVSGDAMLSTPGQPGNWSWHVSGAGITKVTLIFGDNYDPNIGFDLLSFTADNCP